MDSSLWVYPRSNPTKTPLMERSCRSDAASALRTGQVLVAAEPQGLLGGQVSAQLYIPMAGSALWAHLTDYPRWSEYFPNIACSRQLAPTATGQPRLYQVGQKSLMGIPTAGELYLQVHESPPEHIQLRLEQGIFSAFDSTLQLQPWRIGTLLTYTIQVTLKVPLPWFVLSQGIQQDLPLNLKHMRQVICGDQPTASGRSSA
ncbi:MAG: cyclase [Cyanobacteria bacterium]|nr:cyclase [Cyanobacteriota bacterium]MDA0865445.1 cyclase [Cyanobacteriota bacterium]